MDCPELFANDENGPKIPVPGGGVGKRAYPIDADHELAGAAQWTEALSGRRVQRRRRPASLPVVRYNASLGNWRGGPVTRRQAQKSRTGTSPIPKKSILCGSPAPLAPGCFLVGLLFRCAQIVYVSICLRLNDASGLIGNPD